MKGLQGRLAVDLTKVKLNPTLAAVSPGYCPLSASARQALLEVRYAAASFPRSREASFRHVSH